MFGSFLSLTPSARWLIAVTGVFFVGVVSWHYFQYFDPRNIQLVEGELRPQITEALSGRVGFTSHGGTLHCRYSVLGCEKQSGVLTAYVLVLCEEHLCGSDFAEIQSGTNVPAKVTIGNGQVTTIKTPRDGGYFSSDVDKLFPAMVRSRASWDSRVERMHQDILASLGV